MIDDYFVSYAQNAEDVVLARAFRPDAQPGFWIDAGAGDPIVDSVTAAFAERGWTGINVEPYPEAYGALCEARPRDVNLPFALGEKPGFAKLFPGPTGSPGLSTLVPEYADLFSGGDDDPSPVEVEVRTLADIVLQHAPSVVDFLKVDVEGWERQALAGADWALFRPRVVVVEATVPGTAIPTYGDWEPILLDAGYHFVLFDGLNRFYVADGEAELAERLAAPASVLDDFIPHAYAVERERITTYVSSLEAVVETLRTEGAAASSYVSSLEAELALARARAQDAATQAQSLEADVRSVEEGAATEIRSIARRARVSMDRAAVAECSAMDLSDQLSVAHERVARALSDADRLTRYVTELEATRTFRYTAGARGLYYRIRRFGRWVR